MEESGGSRGRFPADLSTLWLWFDCLPDRESSRGAGPSQSPASRQALYTCNSAAGETRDEQKRHLVPDL